MIQTPTQSENLFLELPRAIAIGKRKEAIDALQSSLCNAIVLGKVESGVRSLVGENERGDRGLSRGYCPMDSLKAKYRSIVEQLLVNYAEFLGNDEVDMELVFDRDRYLLVETGWHDGYRIYGSLLHIDIIDDKIWIQHDGTEEGVAEELANAGISKDCIVLGFKSIERRKLTEFAVS